MALPAHALRAVQVTLKSLGNERHFTLEARIFYRAYLPSHCSGVTEICLMALSAHALQAVQVRLGTWSGMVIYIVVSGTRVFVRFYLCKIDATLFSFLVTQNRKNCC
jgi:hypothetical protein